VKEVDMAARISVALALLALLAIGSVGKAQRLDYEVWTVDQADAGNGGDRLYI